MGRLRAALQAKYKDRDEEIKIHTPRNLEELSLTFRGERVAKVSRPLEFKPTPRVKPDVFLGHWCPRRESSQTWKHNIGPPRRKRLFLHTS